MILALAANDGRRAHQGKELWLANRPLRKILQQRREWTWAWIAVICVVAGVGFIATLTTIA